MKVLTRNQGRCEDCECSGLNLEMHHLRYRIDDFRCGKRNFGGLIFGHETENDLDALCRDCHLQRHLDINNDFWVDPEERDDHWFGYFWALEKDD